VLLLIAFVSNMSCLSLLIHSLTKLGHQKYLPMLWWVFWTSLVPKVLSMNQSDGHTGQLAFMQHLHNMLLQRGFHAKTQLLLI